MTDDQKAEDCVMRGPKSVDVGLDLKVFSIKGTWEPNDAERRAAWELYVELITRVAVVPLTGGLLREALTSFYALFGISRDILKRYGPDVAEPKPTGQYNLGYLTVALLNFTIRPLLSRWHPDLQAWEHTRPANVSPAAHEQAWEHAAELRQDIDTVGGILAAYAATLATACGVPDLRAAIPTTVPAKP
jgi:hypothetical protein